jgi:hypothetical protein
MSVFIEMFLASSAENVVSWQQSGQFSHCSGPAITAHGSLDFKQEIYIQNSKRTWSTLA